MIRILGAAWLATAISLFVQDDTEWALAVLVFGAPALGWLLLGDRNDDVNPLGGGRF